MSSEQICAGSWPSDDGLRRLEWLAIKQYQKELSQERRCEVDFAEARRLWQLHRAIPWRQAWQRDYLSCQREEILKHKWIESEKASRDLGSEAVFDWITRFAAQWRAIYEHEQEKKLMGSDGTSTV